MDSVWADYPARSYRFYIEKRSEKILLILVTFCWPDYSGDSTSKKMIKAQYNKF